VSGPRLTYIGGPTALIEWAGLRLLTDPTFDPAGSAYQTPVYTLRKTQGPAVEVAALGSIDGVLLSHDHHFDNLDVAGRALLGRVPRTLTTGAGAGRLGGGAVGLEPWDSLELPRADGRTLRITATPARHGPADLDRGPVIGFVLQAPEAAIYISGDTVWYEGAGEVARRFTVQAAVLFMGAARVAAVGPWPLTLTAADAVEAAQAFGNAVVVPLHFEGWEHFSESREEIETAFARAGLLQRLRWPEPGRPIDLTSPGA
jgi:L-ascorbate metabolism protein UlaG (beta-lactamase superfamily)